jgi:hypothetical protein
LGRLYPIIVIALALAAASPLVAKEYRSREVTREFQREHPCPSTGLTTQRERFIEAARELGCDDDEQALKARMKRLAESKPTPLKSLVKKSRKKSS